MRPAANQWRPMANRPESAAGDAEVGLGDPDSPSEQTIRLDPRPERESHSVHEAVPGTPAGLPSVQRDANTHDVSASTAVPLKGLTLRHCH